MKLKVFSSLLLGCLLVMTAQGNSSSRVVQGQEGNKNKLEATEIPSMYDQKEPFERTTRGALIMRKLGLERKELVTTHEGETSMDSKHGKGAKGEEGTSKMISGMEKDGFMKSLGSLQEQKNDQKQMIMGQMASKFTNLGKSRRPTKTNMKCSQDSCKSSSRSYHQQISDEETLSTNHKDESDQSLDEAAKEIATLIYRDYKGRPSHKPPINN